MLPRDCKWVAAGDWNFVENPEDKSTNNGRIITGQEKAEFELLKAHLQLRDFFPPQSRVIYSWDNLRRGEGRVLARLDRMYAFACEHGAPNSHIQTYEILGTSCNSDHKPVLFKIENRNIRTRGARYKMNGHYLSDPVVVEHLHTLWRSYPRHLSFFAKMKRCLWWYKELCINKARERREAESNLRQRLALT
jgi:hypothetical protein